MTTFLELDFIVYPAVGGPVGELRPTDWPYPTEKRLLSLYDVKLAGEEKRRLYTPRYTEEYLRTVLAEGQYFSVWAVSFADGKAIWWAGDIRIKNIDDEGIIYE